MSEPLLKAIIKLFAIVAKEDEVTSTERLQIEQFLKDHLNDKAIAGYLEMFDSYSSGIVVENKDNIWEEMKVVKGLCNQVNQELTQKQKTVIIMELMGIILADGEISQREEELLLAIADAFNVPDDEVSVIKQYVVCKSIEDIIHDQILIIDGSHRKTDPEFRYLHRHGIDGFIAILHLQSSDSYFIRYIGKSDLYLNGIPIQKNKVYVFAVGSTLRGDRYSPIYFGDVITQFNQNDDNARITFEAEHISYEFPNGKLGLRDVSIIEESGRLIGLMGASGAGKSTLLNVLNGTEAPSEGAILINGINIHKETKKIEGVIGFVPQDDLLIEDLTVYQNLFYSAKLCFSHLTEVEIDELVVKTLQNLGLTETRDLKVGSPLQKTISGGQRKRLNIGLELLREPSVMFVDEPTSGLSSRDSENIMDLLKELSLKGKLVFVVIHQPSSDIFKMFDKLVILDTGGYQIYYGNPVEAVVYFKSIINMINSEQGECHECGNVNPEQIFNIIETKVVNEYGNFTDERKVSAEMWNKHFKKITNIPQIDTSAENPPVSLKIPNKAKQVKIFSIRDTLSKLSNKQYLFINLLEAPLLAFVLAYIVRYFSVDSADATYIFGKNPNIPAYLFMSVIVSLFMGLTVSAEEIIRDRKILKRESFLNLSRFSYLISKISILFFLSAIQTFTFVLVGNYVLGIHDMYFAHWLILFSTSCMANVLGLNISSSFNSAVTIYILIPILLIPQLILSGVVVRFDQLNPTLSTTGKVPIVGEVMTSRWAFEAAMVAQFKDNPYENQFFQFDKILAETDYKRIYYIPELETKLDFCYNNRKSTDPSIISQMEQSFLLLRNEITKEMSRFDEPIFTKVELLRKEGFDKQLRDETAQFFQTLKKYYTKINQQTSQRKELFIQELTDTPEKRKAFQDLKNTYFNQSISDLVKNQADPQRIVEADGQLFQKIFPIYMNPNPLNKFDFRTDFYVASKTFLGRKYDTFNFNIVVIWSMSIFLMITLYFDVLRNILEYLEKKISRNKF